MSSTNDNGRGWLRRFALLHMLYTPFLVVVGYMLGGHMHWNRAWVLVLPFILPVATIPFYRRFRRLAVANGFSARNAFVMYFGRGISVHVLEARIRQREEREAAWGQLIRIITTEEPDLLERIEALHKEDKYDWACGLVKSRQVRKRAKEQHHQEKIASIRCEAEQLHCTHLVEPELRQERLAVCEAILTSARGLIERAKRLGIYDDVALAIVNADDSDFSEAEALLKKAVTQHELDRLHDSYCARITKVPPHERGKLRGMLDELIEHGYGSRSFRKKQHELDVELARAIGAS